MSGGNSTIIEIEAALMLTCMWHGFYFCGGAECTEAGVALLNFERMYDRGLRKSVRSLADWCSSGF